MTSASDRRTQQRAGFKRMQRMAFGNWKTAPPAQAFRDVLCQDISATGFSCLLKDVPAGEFVVELSGPAAQILMRAEVVNSRPAAADDDLFLVGCRFLGRL